MRRTTIFRSNRAAVLLAASLTIGVQGLGAQEGAAPAGQGRTHLVQAGETLWGLAQVYLGDPLLWPEIYRLNTQVVEDPHWIFPGEQLVLAAIEPGAAAGVAEPAPAEPVAAAPAPAAPPAAEPAVVPQPAVEVPAPGPADVAAMPDTGQAAPALDRPSRPVAPLAPPPPPPAESGPTIFTPRERNTGPLALTSGQAYRSVVAGQFYAAGFLTERDALPWGTVRAKVGATLGSLSATASAVLFDRIELGAPAGAAYRVGDSLLIAQVGRNLPAWGFVVVPTGIARVVSVEGERAVGEIVTQFGRITNGQSTLPIEPFRDPGAVEPVPIENGPAGTIIAIRDLHPVPGQQDFVFIDLGREAGVAPGDVFDVFELRAPDADRAAPLQRIAVLQIAHVRTRSATGRLQNIFELGVRDGAPVRLVRKMPT